MNRIIPALAAFTVLAGCASDPSNVRTMSGAEMYEQLCASCHGVTGHGDGAFSTLLEIGVPDLTRIADRNGGKFPAEDVRRTIDGRWDRRAHGARDMPVWGWRFYEASSPNDAEERARVDAMIGRLIDYLRMIQRG
jgi:mono/diheme cytochrome c family protein